MTEDFIYPEWMEGQTPVRRLMIVAADPGAATKRHVALLRRIAERRVRTLTARFTPSALWIQDLPGTTAPVAISLEPSPFMAANALVRLGVRRIDAIVSDYPAEAMEHLLVSGLIPFDATFIEVVVSNGKAELPRWTISAERRRASHRALAQLINATAPELRVEPAYVPEPDSPVRYRVNAAPLRAGEPLKVLIPALSTDTMDLRRLGEALRALADTGAPVQVYALRDPSDEGPLPELKGLIQLGLWGQADFNSLICLLRPHLAWLPYSVSRGYDYLLSDVMHQGLPLLVSDMGAAPERLVGRDKTWVMPAATPGAELAAFLSSLHDNGVSSPSRTPEHAGLPPAMPGYYPDSYTAPITADMSAL